MMPIGREFCAILAKAGLASSVIEVGSKPAPGQLQLADLRPIMGTDQYVGTDMEAGPGVDFVCDGEMLGWHFGEGVFTLGLCMDTLEHCRRPEKVIGALAKVSVHLALRVAFCAPIHLHPEDYWRMTPSCVEDILRRLRPHGFVAQDWPVIGVPAGQEYDWPHGIYGFATPEEAARDDVIHLLQQRPARDIMVTRLW